MSTRYSDAELCSAVETVFLPPTYLGLPHAISVWREFYDQWRLHFLRISIQERLDQGHDQITQTYDIHPSDAQEIVLFIEDEDVLIKKLNKAAACIQRWFRGFSH